MLLKYFGFLLLERFSGATKSTFLTFESRNVFKNDFFISSFDYNRFRNVRCKFSVTHIAIISEFIIEFHVYNPPFCERHQWGHEKDAFANFFCYNVVEGNTVNYRNRGGEWWGCIAATPHVYMFRFSVKASMTGANP